MEQDAVEHLRKNKLRLYLLQPVAIILVFGILAGVLFGLYKSDIASSTKYMVILVNIVLWGGLGLWCLKNWVTAMIKGAK